jgi:hypothetical protein
MPGAAARIAAELAAMARRSHDDADGGLWMYVILFGIIGGFRGWAKELLVIFSVLLAIAIDTVLLTYVDSVRIIMTSRPGLTQFGIRAGLLLTLTYFGYQTPNLPAFASGKFAREKLQDFMLGVALGW